MHALRLVTTSQRVNRRRSKRCVLEQRTSGIVRFGDRLEDCIIEDISLGGARLRFDRLPPVGETMVLEHLVAGCFPGRIVWTKSDAAGFQFDRPERPLERELQCVALMIGSDETQSVRRPVP